MIPMLSQLEHVPSEFLKNTALVIAGLLAAAYYGKELLEKKKISEITPQPLTVQKFSPCANKDEFHHHVAENKREHENIFAKIGGVDRGSSSRVEQQIASLRTERSAHDANIQTQLTKMNTEVAALDAKTNLQNVDLGRIWTEMAAIKVDVKNTPADTVALLKTTKGLL